MSEYRAGIGWDVHRLVAGRPLILGGVTIESEFGLEGHSDADVLAHAITDAILGATALGDIGMHFPDTDPRWKDSPGVLWAALATRDETLRKIFITNHNPTSWGGLAATPWFMATVTATLR